MAADDILDIHKYLMKKKNMIEKILDLLEKKFTAMTCFGYDIINVNPLKCVSINNQECKVTPKIINTNNNELSFYPYSVKVDRCNGSCNNISDPYAKICVLML